VSHFDLHFENLQHHFFEHDLRNYVITFWSKKQAIFAIGKEDDNDDLEGWGRVQESQNKIY